MPRVTRGPETRKRRKKILKEAKGYYGGRHRYFKNAKETVHRAWQYQYRDRRQKKRDFRRLWITRINAAAREHGVSYSKLMGGLSNAGIELNRKMLAEMAIFDPEAFEQVVEAARDEI
ncbi:MAG: 50S ribosomal protein L20 [Bradymonadaceae bacterium]